MTDRIGIELLKSGVLLGLLSLGEDMIQKIKIGKCCHSRSRQSRFDAEVGDIVLIREDSAYLEAKITAILSADLVAVSVAAGDSLDERKVPREAIIALMVGD